MEDIKFEKIEKLSTIDPKTIVRVFNNTTGSVGIKTENFSVTWEFPDVEKRISFEKLQDAMTYTGVVRLFEGGELLIKDNNIREALYLDALGKYDLDSEQVKELLENSELVEFEDVIEYCSNAVFEKIVSTAVAIRLNDMGKLGIIKKYSGMDVYEIIKDNEEIAPTNDKEVQKRKPVR